MPAANRVSAFLTEATKWQSVSDMSVCVSTRKQIKVDWQSNNADRYVYVSLLCWPCLNRNECFTNQPIERTWSWCTSEDFPAIERWRFIELWRRVSSMAGHFAVWNIVEETISSKYSVFNFVAEGSEAIGESADVTNGTVPRGLQRDTSSKPKVANREFLENYFSSGQSVSWHLDERWLRVLVFWTQQKRRTP